MFYSRKRVNTYTCMAKIWLLTTLKDYLFSIVFGGVALFWFVSKLFSCIKNRRSARLASDIYGEVKQTLQTNGASFAGLSERDIMGKYLRRTPGKDGLKRDESTFRNTIWPLLQQQRKNDR